MASISPIPKLQFFDLNGDPLREGKLYTYLSGTTTPQPTYTTAAADEENTNPVILDARGEASVYLDQTVQYRFDLYDSDDVQVWPAPIDQVNPLPDPIQPSGFYTPDFGPDSAQRVTDSRLQDSVHIKDFTLVCDGVTDEWEKFFDALTWCIANNRSLKITGNCYLGDSVKSWPGDAASIRIWSDGDGILSAGATNGFVSNNIQNYYFDGLRIEADTNTSFLVTGGSSRMKFTNCRFRNVALSNFTGAGSEDIYNFEISGCVADGWSGEFFSVHGATAFRDLIIRNNIFMNGVDGIRLGNAIDPIVCENFFRNLSGYGVQYSSGQSVTISKNTFESVSSNNLGARAIQHESGASETTLLKITDNYFRGDSVNTGKAMVSWGALYGAALGNYCTTTLHQIPTGTTVSIFNDYGEISTISGDTINSRNVMTGGQNYMLDVNSANNVGTELKLRNTSAAGVALMRFQTTTTGFTVDDGSYIANVTGSGDLIIENKEAGFIKVATDGFETLKIGHNGTSDTLQVRSGNATSTELAVRNAGGSAGVALARFQTAFTGYTASDGTVMGNVASSGDFRIDNQEGGSVIIATGGADRVNVSTSSVIVSPPLILTPPSSISLSTNGQMTFELLSNTELVVKVRGSDGTTRTNLLTLS